MSDITLWKIPDDWFYQFMLQDNLIQKLKMKGKLYIEKIKS